MANGRYSNFWQLICLAFRQKSSPFSHASVQLDFFREPLLRLSLVLLSGSLLLGCGSSSSSSNLDSESVLVFARESESGVLDPIHTDVGETVKVVVNIFEPLVTYAKDSLKIVPCLAASWEVDKTGTAWTFNLRKEVKFHDGTDFDAAAVVYNFERLTKEGHEDVFSDVIPFAPSFQSIQKIEIVNTHQLIFHLSYPDAVFLQNMCMYSACMVSPTACHKLGQRFGTEPVGTGPYQMSRWDQDQTLELKAFENYWGGKPEIARVIFIPVTETQSRALYMKTGKAHIADNLPADIVESLSKEDSLMVQEVVGVNVGYLSMNNVKAPLDDVRVRQAIWYAIDKPQLIEQCYAGKAKPAATMLPPTMFAHHAEIKEREHNLKKAKALLKEAGVQLPLKLRLHQMMTARPYMQRPRETAILLKNQLAKIGIEVEIIIQDNNVHFQQLSAGEHELGLAGWSSDNNDPDNFLYQLLDSDNIGNGANNTSRYQNQKVHELLTGAKRIVDQSEREKMYLRAQELIHADAPVVPLVHTDVQIILNKRVQGYKLHPASLVRFRWSRMGK